MTRGVLLVLVAVPLLAAADPGDDLKKMQGDWQVVAHEIAGMKAPAEQLQKADLRLIIDGNKFKYTTAGKELVQGTFTLAKGNQIDVLGKDPGGKEDKTLGIYEVNAETIRVCFVPNGEKRPTKFETKAGEMVSIITYKRVKK